MTENLLDKYDSLSSEIEILRKDVKKRVEDLKKNYDIQIRSSESQKKKDKLTDNFKKKIDSIKKNYSEKYDELKRQKIIIKQQIIMADKFHQDPLEQEIDDLHRKYTMKASKNLVYISDEDARIIEIIKQDQNKQKLHSVVKNVKRNIDLVEGNWC
jgi:hypothetical protein